MTRQASRKLLIRLIKHNLKQVLRSVPEQGQLAVVRQRRYVVTDVRSGANGAQFGERPQHLVSLTSIEDDALGEELQVIWEIEPGARAFEKMDLPEPKGFDQPAHLEAFLDAVRWGAASIADNSFNIHEIGTRFVFLEPENQRAKLMSFARNDKLFTGGEDLAQLGLETRYVIGGSGDAPNKFRVIILRGDWLKKPWNELDPAEHPDQWYDRIPLLVLPEEPDDIHARLGEWLKAHVPRRRNTVRFLIPKSGAQNAFLDRDLIILARAIVKADEWRKEDGEYGRLHTKYRNELHGILKVRFDRYAILDTWNYQEAKSAGST